MAEVSIRDLRNHGGDVVDRVAQGESVTITRSGRPVAELRPVAARAVRAAVLIARRRNLPEVDPETVRRDLDAVLDPAL